MGIDPEKFPGMAKLAAGDGPEWLSQCLCGDKGTPFPNLHNVLIALDSDLLLRGRFAYDLMQQVPLLMQSLNLAAPDDVASSDTF